MTLPTFILGHNALIGVDHVDRSRTEVKHELAHQDQALLDAAVDLGVRAVLLDNHPVAIEAARYLTESNAPIRVIPMVPYAQAAVDKASSAGLAALVEEMAVAALRMGPRQWAGIIRDMTHGSTTSAGGRVAVAHYLAGFTDRRPPVCFLHNAVTDLMVGWRNRAGLAGFAAACRSRGITPGFVTLNPGEIPFVADAVGNDTWFMCAVNSRGIQMSPSRERAEEVLNDERFKVVAMSVLGGGLLDPRDEIPRALAFPAVRSVVIGTSKVHHLRQSVEITRDALNVGTGVERA